MSPTYVQSNNSEAAGSSRSFWKLFSKTKGTDTSSKSVTSSVRGHLTTYSFSPFSISVCFPPHCYCPEITLPNKTIIYISVSSWRRKWQPTPVFLPGESYGQRSLAGYCPWGRKESDMTELWNSTVSGSVFESHGLR